MNKKYLKAAMAMKLCLVLHKLNALAAFEILELN